MFCRDHCGFRQNYAFVNSPSFVPTSSLMAARYCFIPFLSDVETPPDAAFPYIRGRLVYCLFFSVRFRPGDAILRFDYFHWKLIRPIT